MRSSMVNRWIAAGLVVLVLGSALLLGGVLAAQAAPARPGAGPGARPGAATTTPTAPALATAPVSATATPTSTSVPPLPGSPTPAWWPVSSPDIGGLGAVTGVGADDVWAVGGTDSLHWDGSAWRQVPVPSPTQGGSAPLWKASAGAANSVWAGGGIPANWGRAYRVLGRPAVDPDLLLPQAAAPRPLARRGGGGHQCL